MIDMSNQNLACLVARENPLITEKCVLKKNTKVIYFLIVYFYFYNCFHLFKKITVV